MTRRWVWLAGAAIWLAPTVAARAQVALGTNYGWYSQDNPVTPQSGANPFSNYDAVSNYDTQTAPINAQLAQMRANGQTTIAIPLYPATGLDFGSLLDTPGGNLNPHDLRNLSALIAEIKSLGFTSILYRFNFQANNVPSLAAAAGLEATNSQLIANLTNEVFDPAGIPYKVDLTGGAVSENTSPTTLAYDKAVYQAYVAQFGTANTIGFSAPVWDQTGLDNLAAIYGPTSTWPSELGFTFYGGHGRPSAYTQFTVVHQDLANMGIDLPWIIAETYYNDPTSAAEFQAAMNDTGQVVTALYQWQNTGDGTIIIPPVDIAAYQILDPTPVPEPGTFAIMAGALVGLAIFRRRVVSRRLAAAGGFQMVRVSSRPELALRTCPDISGFGHLTAIMLRGYASRAIEVSVVLLIGLVLLPVIAVAGALIKWEDGGPVFYRQQRVGFRGRLFTIIKLRTMRVDAESESGPVWALSGDKRITRAGQVFRKTRIDEIPQLWNVLRGDMRLVGPRPERPHFSELLSAHIPSYAARVLVKPGLTGLAQVTIGYAASVEQCRAKLDYDLRYIRSRNFLLDMRILLLTVPVLLGFRPSLGDPPD